MLVVMLGLYAEGNTDANIDEESEKRPGFLPPIIRRTTENILLRQGQSLADIEIQIPYSRWEKPDGIVDQDRCILHVASEAAGYDALIIHADSDKRGYEKTLAELFQPGKDLVLEFASNNPKDVCAHLVPLIPVRMTEAWMLADPNAVCTVLKIDQKRAPTLGLPKKVALVEKELNPKRRLDLVIEAAYPKQSKSRQNDFKYKLYKELGSKIDLQRLREVDSYKRFEDDLTAALLHTLGFIQK